MADPTFPPPGPGVTRPREGARIEIPRIELTLQTEGGKHSERNVVLDGELCRIGSHPHNEVALADATVSRFHCQLERSGGGWRLTDSGSLNGTRVNGVPVRDCDLPFPECRIEIGDSALVVRELVSQRHETVADSPSLGALYGSSLPMRRLFDVLRRVAPTEVNVLIEGESGTGKELIAAEIVRRSTRAAKPVVIVDCGAIAPTLMESELFGHARGAFTGADRARTGAFEAADGGTIFLDEIGELPLALQPKLLRAIEAREIRRVGENEARKIDVRLVAATHRRLEREVNQGRFREDLFFRLSVVTVRVPPLRERTEDMRLLVDSFLSALGATDKASLFTHEVMESLRRHDWPGNVRELRNFVERMVVLEGEDASLRVGDPSSKAPPATPAIPADIEVPFRRAKDDAVDRFEKGYLTQLLAWAEGNVSRAARKAAVDRMYLHRLLQRHGLKRAASLE